MRHRGLDVEVRRWHQLASRIRQRRQELGSLGATGTRAMRRGGFELDHLAVQLPRARGALE